MTRKILFFLVVGVFCVALSGLAAAEAPVSTFPEEPSWQSGTDSSGSDLSYDLQLFEPVETGAMPAKPGDSPDSCCANSSEPKVDENGFVVIRHGIDDGP